ncbi:MAG: type II toxin-antitoxin system RelE/ParE family toxin [Caulobacteraceae bacterium]
MSYRVSGRARRDLDEIAAFIAVDSPRAAIQQRDAIRAAFELIGENPSIGHVRPDITDKPLRFWNVSGRYTVIYRENGAEAFIARVLGAGRDIANLLG